MLQNQDCLSLVTLFSTIILLVRSRDLLVIIDIQLSRWICRSRSTERNAHEILAENAREYRLAGGAEATLLVEHFVDDILSTRLISNDDPRKEDE